jgi:hypothetical protein
VSTVIRFDAATLGQAKRTPQGFLRATARLTRTGVLAYRQPDGTVRRELRRPEQVFHADSLATLNDAPLTDLHPKVMVTAENARELSLGHVSHASARADGKFVSADVVVTDAKMIAAIEGKVDGKTRSEISCGYKCKLIPGGGEWNGERYDAEQVDIVYNHAGLGPKNWGRAGSECALRLDGNDDGFALDASDAWVVDAADAPDDEEPKGKAMELVTLKVDGIDCQVPKECAQIVQKGLTTRDEAIAQAAKDATASKARLDALEGELDGTKTKLVAATDPKRFDAAVTERIALLDRAHAVLGAEAKLDSLSAREIKESVLKKVDPKATFENKSDEYVQGRFDSIELPAPSTDMRGVRRASLTRPTTLPETRRDSNDPPKIPVPAWRQPLAAHRE